jgi:hypothetical protein
MTNTDDVRIDLEGSLALWIGMPDPADPDVASWASEAATDAVASRGLDQGDVRHVHDFLLALSAEERPAGYSWRLLFLAHPAYGATVWDIAFLAPDPSVTDEQLVRADQTSQLGSSVDRFTWHGIDGVQCLRFELTALDGEGSAAGSDQAISSQALIAVTRELGGRPTTLLARAVTAHLESLTMSCPPMQYFLTSDLLAELVTGEDSPRPATDG